jgi:hypothetical protein
MIPEGRQYPISHDALQGIHAMRAYDNVGDLKASSRLNSDQAAFVEI